MLGFKIILPQFGVETQEPVQRTKAYGRRRNWDDPQQTPPRVIFNSQEEPDTAEDETQATIAGTDIYFHSSFGFTPNVHLSGELDLAFFGESSPYRRAFARGFNCRSHSLG